MEIHYCKHCGKKIDSDEIARGEAVHTIDNEVSCRGCLTEADVPKTKSGSRLQTPRVPAKPRTGQHVPVAQPRVESHAHAAAPRAAQAGPSPATFVVIGGVILLLIGGLMALKPRPVDKASATERATERATESPRSEVKSSTEKAVQPKAPPKAVDQETAASDALSEILKTERAKSPKAQITALEDFLKQHPNAMVAGRARTELNKAKIYQKLTADGLLTIASFEPNDDWGFHNGAEFPGAKGDRSYDDTVRKDGTRSIKIKADFTGGGGYVAVGKVLNEGSLGEMIRSIPFNQVKGLRLWVKSPKVSGISLRIDDSSKQCHQLPQRFTPKDDWQMIEIKSFTSGPRYEHFGGKNDGVFHWPLHAMSILVGKDVVEPEKAGEVWIDQVELVLTTGQQ
jgi:hypothetical protein